MLETAPSDFPISPEPESQPPKVTPLPELTSSSQLPTPRPQNVWKLVSLGLVVIVVGLGAALAYQWQKPAATRSTISEVQPSVQPTPSLEPTPTPQSSPVASSSSTPKKVTKSTTDYTGWQTYRDTQAGFSIKYPADHKTVDANVVAGKSVSFTNCALGTCSTGFSIEIYNDYTGGSRREWLGTKFDLSTYQVTYEDYSVAGVNALIANVSDSGSTGAVYVVIPKGNRVFLVSRGASGVDYLKSKLDTFAFLN